MKSARGFAPILIVLIILASIVAVAGGLIAYQKYFQEKPELTKEQDSKIAKLGTPEDSPVDEIANWKTYTSEKMGFSIQYPPDMNVVAAPPPIELNSASFLLSFPRETDIPPFSQQILIYKKEVKGGISIEQSITSYDPNSIKSVPITIGGKNGLFFETVPAYSDTSDAFVIKEGQIWSFRLTGSGDHENKIPVFKQILSTFKFTE